MTFIISAHSQFLQFSLFKAWTVFSASFKIDDGERLHSDVAQEGQSSSAQTHVNLFDAEEGEWKKATREREAMLEKQRKGNHLACTGQAYGNSSKWLYASAEQLSEFSQATKVPWYATRRDAPETANAITTSVPSFQKAAKKTKRPRKSIDELRKERLDREARECIRSQRILSV